MNVLATGAQLKEASSTRISAGRIAIRRSEPACSTRDLHAVIAKQARTAKAASCLERPGILGQELREGRILSKHGELRHTRNLLAIFDTLFQSFTQINQGSF